MHLNYKSTVLGAVLVLGLFIPTARADVEYPSGAQTFETMNVGDDVSTIGSWFKVNESAPPEQFTVVAADDVLGTQTTRGSSTRWLRIDDQDGGAVQNRFYSTPISAPIEHNYTWSYYVNLETTPPGGTAVKPKLTIQHNNTPGGFMNTWGIEFTSTGANLIVLANGGTPASSPLYSLAPPTGVGDWVKLTLTVNFDVNTVSASVNDGASVSLPINLNGTADKKVYRLCYRGEGTGNIQKMLLDYVNLNDSSVPDSNACCDGNDGSCGDGVDQRDCLGNQQQWTPNTLCAALDPPCEEHRGACCETLKGTCEDGVFGSICQGAQHIWTKGATCADVELSGDCEAVLGACCDGDAFGSCTQTTSNACNCGKCVWHKLLTCAQIECTHNPIPTVSHWGLVVLTLLLLIGAKIYFAHRQPATAL